MSNPRLTMQVWSARWPESTSALYFAKNPYRPPRQAPRTGGRVALQARQARAHPAQICAHFSKTAKTKSPAHGPLCRCRNRPQRDNATSAADETAHHSGLDRRQQAKTGPASPRQLFASGPGSERAGLRGVSPARQTPGRPRPPERLGSSLLYRAPAGAPPILWSSTRTHPAPGHTAKHPSADASRLTRNARPGARSERDVSQTDRADFVLRSWRAARIVRPRSHSQPIRLTDPVAERTAIERSCRVLPLCEEHEVFTAKVDARNVLRLHGADTDTVRDQTQASTDTAFLGAGSSNRLRVPGPCSLSILHLLGTAMVPRVGKSSRRQLRTLRRLA